MPVEPYYACFVFQKERKTLETKRLDLDVAKGKYKRATTQGKEAVS